MLSVIRGAGEPADPGHLGTSIENSRLEKLPPEDLTAFFSLSSCLVAGQIDVLPK